VNSSPNWSLLGDLGDLTASLVVDESGSPVSASGTSRGLGNETDFALLMHLRRRSEVVLTSGLTARLEEYRMPSSADLAILSRSSGYYPAEQAERKLVQLGPNPRGYLGAITALQELGYNRIQTEFGPTGFLSIATLSSARCLLSSKSYSGIETFVSAENLSVESSYELPELVIATVSGRG